MQVATIGRDIAKRVFQIHGIDSEGAIVKRSELLNFFQRLAPCLVGIEACATAHYWARELSGLGHQVPLVPPSYVKAYLKRGKNDAADAEAICEAVTGPNMRFVPVKSAEQQGVLVLHRARELLVRQRTMLVNGLRAHKAEFGIIVPQGIQRLPELVAMLEDRTSRIPQMARDALTTIVAQINSLTTSIRQLDKRVVAWCRANDAARRLATIPGVGPITASALAATIISTCFDPAAILRPGLVWFRASTRPAARRSLVGSRKWATSIYASFLTKRGHPAPGACVARPFRTLHCARPEAGEAA
jgi:transposase